MSRDSPPKQIRLEQRRSRVNIIMYFQQQNRVTIIVIYFSKLSFFKTMMISFHSVFSPTQTKHSVTRPHLLNERESERGNRR